MTTAFKTLTVAALAASLGLAGCADGSGTSGSASASASAQAGETGSHASSSPAATPAPDASADHNDADVVFAQMMIPHHAQAVEMSDIILSKPDVPADVAALAATIKAAQVPEIETMTGWLDAWNQPTEPADGHSGHGKDGHGTDGHGMDGHGMSGMVDEEGLDQLKAAPGVEASRLFLEQMIGHHEGAVDMAKQELSAGKHAGAIQLARDIITAQEAEIAEMKQLLTTL